MAKSLKNMMGAGIGAGTATLINGTVADGLTATGSNQSDALILTSDVNVVSTVPVGAGVRLLAVPQPGDEVLISNLGVNALAVYPPIGGTISGAAVNSPFSLPAGAASEFVARKGSANWVALSSGAGLPALGTLSLSATTFTRGAATSGSIIGVTALSTITASGLPSGLTIDGAARTWAWDGSGSGSSNSTLTLTETLAGYSNTPHDTVISYSIIVGGSLATPTLTNSSSLGAIPVVLSWSDTDYTAGLYGQLEIDQTSNAFANITQNIVFFVDGASWSTLDEAIGLQSPAGTYYARIRAVRENESGATTVTGIDPIGNAVSFLADVSAWSNTFTDTIGAQAALNTVNGANKDSLLTVTGSPALSFSGTSANGNNSVRSTLQQGFAKAQFEITITSGGATGTTVVGIEDGATNFNTVHGMPGLDGTAGVGSGIAIAFYASGSTVSIFHSAGGTEIDLINSAGTIANGDTFTIVYDKTNNTLEVHRTRSGVTTQMGSTQTGLPALSAQYAYCGTRSSTSAGTMNFGSTAYAKTPGSGVAAFWA